MKFLDEKGVQLGHKSEDCLLDNPHFAFCSRQYL